MSAQGSLTRLATQCQGNMPSPFESEGSEEAEGSLPRRKGDNRYKVEFDFEILRDLRVLRGKQVL